MESIETTQFRQVIQMRYGLKSGMLSLNLEGYGNYASALSSMDIDPKKVAIEELAIDHDSIAIQFSQPIICNMNSDGVNSYMDCGVALSGKSPKEFIEKISVIDHTKMEWDRKVAEFRAELERRWRYSRY